jgi:glycogen(starch) synthase
VLESLSTGTPVIVTTAGGLPELVTDGATGRHFAPGDAAGLESAMASMIHDAPKMRRAARASYDERMTADRSADLLQIAYARAKRRAAS